MVQALDERHDVRARIGDRERLAAALLVALVGDRRDRARGGERLLAHLDADRVGALPGEPAHEVAVAAADVDDGAALEGRELGEDRARLGHYQFAIDSRRIAARSLGPISTGDSTSRRCCFIALATRSSMSSSP